MISRTLILLALLLGASQFAHAQVQSCTSSVAVGAAYSACATTAPNSAPLGNTKIMYCGNVTTAGAAQSACPSAVWQNYNWLASWSWVLTTYGGWQRLSDVTYGSTPPPPPPPPPSQPNPPGSPVVTLPALVSWFAVTQGTVGEAVTPTGYRIEYGQGNFASTKNVAGTETSAVISGLASGVWQFRVVAITTGGESVAANAANFTLPACASP